MEKVLASFIYINPRSALEYKPKALDLNPLAGFCLSMPGERNALLKFMNAGAADTPANAYKLLFNLRFNCKPKGTSTTVAPPPLVAIKFIPILL